MAFLVHSTSGKNAAASDEQVDELSPPTCAGGSVLVLQELQALQDCWMVSWQELQASGYRTGWALCDQRNHNI